MPELLSPGVVVTEPRVTPNEVAAASTSVGALIGIAERGPINDPVLIGSFDEYVAIFDGYYLSSPLPGAVQGFFANGGRSCYVGRVGHYTDITDAATLDAVKATLQLSGTGPANTALISASSEGGHGNALSLTTLRVDTKVATTGAIGVSATTEATLSDVRRVRVGHQLRIFDDVTPANLLRVVVTRVDTALKKVFFASNTPSGAITTGTVVLETWDLTVLRNGSFVERITNLHMSSTAGAEYFKSVVNNGDPRRQVEVTTDDALASSNTVDPRPLDITASPLGATTAGSDGTTPNDADHVGSVASRTGLFAFDVVDDVSLIAIPGRPTATVHQAINSYAEGRVGGFGVLATNSGLTPAQAKTYVETTANLYSEYAAVYWPHVKITDPVTGLLATHTPEGHIMGVYARVDATRGVQKAPAGTPDGRLANVLAPEYLVTDAEYDSIYPAHINALKSLPGRGTCVFGSRTLGKGSQFGQINVRRVFNFFERSIKQSTTFLIFEPNDVPTRGKVRKLVSNFALRQWRRGVLKGVSAAEAFFVICDETNNPPSVEQAGQLICRVGLAVARPAEFIIFEFVQDTRALDAELAAAGV